MIEVNEVALAARYFAKHVASHSVAEMDGRTVERLVWREPKVSYNYVQYIAVEGTLFVSGDLGDAVYETGAESLQWWTRCDLHYFAGKCMASEEGRGYRTWDGDAAAVRFDEEIERMRNDGEEIDDNLVYEGRSALVESQWEWEYWLREEGTQLFGQDWWEFAPKFGKVISDRCLLHLLGLKLAIQQLQEGAAA